MEERNVPYHLAIILDGNGRWAKAKGMPRNYGHVQGAKVVEDMCEIVWNKGIHYFTVYAFSTENWNRKPEEVDFLMDLLANTMKSELQEMHEKEVKIKFIGKIEELPQNLKEIIYDAQEKTKDNRGVNLQIAFNYGSRDEIKHAVQKIVEKKIPPEKITEELISQNLYTSNIPDPDLLIRTGGEKRVSNYLLWQIAYSEIIVLSDFWPDFDRQNLADCIMEFQNRKRRFGK